MRDGKFEKFSQIFFLDRNGVNDFTAFLLKSRSVYTEINGLSRNIFLTSLNRIWFKSSANEIAIKNAKDKVLRNIELLMRMNVL